MRLFRGGPRDVGARSGKRGSSASFTNRAPLLASRCTAPRASSAVATSRPSPFMPQDRVGYPPGAVRSGPEKRMRNGG